MHLMSDATLSSLLAGRHLRLADLAKAIGVNKSTVTRWDQNGMPAERVLDVERITGVPRHELRPDLYPSDAASPASTRGE